MGVLTLDPGGCGRFFEGSPADMYESLINRIGKLPSDTLIYCGHEYTRKNLEFAATIEPSNSAITSALSRITSASCSVPSTLADEFQYNPFMRVNENSVQMKMGTVGDGVGTMKALRAAKDRF